MRAQHILVRALLPIFLGFGSISGFAQDSGAQAMGNILALPLMTTFCPTFWPFGIITTVSLTLAGGATAGSATTGISSTSTTSTSFVTTVNLNGGDVPWTEKNMYEALDDRRRDHRGIARGFYKVAQQFFLSPETIEAYHEWRDRRKEKKLRKIEEKKTKKEDKKAAKKAKKEGKEAPGSDKTITLKCEIPEELQQQLQDPELQKSLDGTQIDVPCVVVDEEDVDPRIQKN